MSWSARQDEGVIRRLSRRTADPAARPTAPIDDSRFENYLTMAQANGKDVARAIRGNIGGVWVLGAVLAILAFFGGAFASDAVDPDSGLFGGIVPAAFVLFLTWLVTTGLNFAQAVLSLVVAMSYDTERAGRAAGR